ILPQRAVLPDLLPALQDPRNWQAVLPGGATLAVTLASPKPLDPDNKALRVHPLGVLSVREKVVPLDLTITRYGNAAPADGNSFSLSGTGVQGTIQDYFAAGQFLTLSD